MDRPGDQLLASATLTANENGRRRRRRLPHQLVDLDHPRVASDEWVAQARRRTRLTCCAPPKLPVLEHAVRDREKLLQADRLHEELDRPTPHRRRDCLQVVERCYEDDVDGRTPAPNQLEQGEA